MLLKISVALNALVFLLVIPLLEVGPTHLFNPDWPAHARLHEFWQLVTNGLISLLALWLVTWGRQRVTGALVALAINVGFLVALAAAPLYGGSMVHSDGSELLVAGANPAIIVVGLLAAAIVSSLLFPRLTHAMAHRTTGSPARRLSRPAIWLGLAIAVLVALTVASGSARASEQTCIAAPEWEAGIAAIVSHAMQESGTPGLALGVIHEGKVIYLRGHGVERRSAGPQAGITCRTRFHAASISKPVLATALMKAFYSDEMSEDQRIDQLLGKGGSPATLASLMTHTAGMRDWLRANGRRTEEAKAAYFRRILQRAEKAGPGREFRYSDTDYNILALVLERKSGRSFDAIMQDRVLAPLDMSDSSFVYDDAAAAQAWPHDGSSNKPRANHPFDLAFAGSSGLQTSARDLLLFAQVYLDADQRFMPAQAYAEATRPRHETEWAGISQSLVWQVATANGQPVWQHGGTDDGFRALVTLYPTTRSAIVILANGEKLDRWALRSSLEGLIGLI